MKQVPYKNTKKHAEHIGNKLVMPGQIREVEESLIPGYKPPAPQAVKVDSEREQLLAILDGTVPAITEALPGLSDADLGILEKAEQDGKTRSGVLSAFTKERLDRANNSQGNSDLTEFGESLKGKSDQELADLAVSVVDDADKSALVQAESDRRNTPEYFAEILPGKSDEELDELAKLHQDNAELSALITADLERRTAE